MIGAAAERGGGESSSRGRLAMFAMVKNERDIICDFLDQALVLFDSVFILDHESRDGTWEVCQQVATVSAKVRLFRLRSKRYPQRDVTTWFCREIFAGDQPEWLFLLDADEFLPFNDPTALRHALNFYEDADCLRMRWQNMVPADLTAWRGLDATPLLQVSHPSSFCKVAIHRTAALKSHGRLTIHQGNHDVTADAGAGEPLRVDDAAFQLCHLPMRSSEQIQQKLVLGKLGYYNEPMHRDGMGAHWSQMLDLWLTEGEAPDSLQRRILHYGLTAGEVTASDAVGLEPVTHRFQFAPVCDRSVLRNRMRLAPSLLLWQQVEQLLRAPAALAMEGTGSLPPASDRNYLIVDSTGSILSVGSASDVEPAPPPSFPPPAIDHPLAVVNRADPALCLPATEQDDVALLRQVIAWFNVPPQSIRDTTKTAHVGFIGALLGLARPRTVVALGVREGSRFLALCDACLDHKLDADVMGIDQWDVHAGPASESVPAELYARVSNLYPRVTLIRSAFDMARRRMSAGTVDLLVIDATPTLDAMRHDFAEWFATLSDAGICVFHDAGGQGNQCAVRMLWDELKASWPSVELHYSYGLGVLFIGAHQPPAVSRLLDIWTSSPQARTLLESASELLASTFPVRLTALEQEQTLSSLRREVEALDERLTTVTAAQNRLAVLNDQHQADRERLRNERDQIIGERDRVRLEGDTLRAERDQLLVQRDRLRAQGDRRVREREQARRQADRVREQRDRLAEVLGVMRRSRSWRLTAPLRGLATFGRGLLPGGR